MRLPLLAAVTTAAGLSACAPIAPYSYGYTAVETAPAVPYGYYDYSPGPYYATPYVSPGPNVFIGDERRYRDYDRRPYDRGYRQPQPNREFERPRNLERPRDFGGGRPGPGPGPAQAPRQMPAPVNVPQPPTPSPGPGGHSPSFNPANPTASGERG